MEGNQHINCVYVAIAPHVCDAGEISLNNIDAPTHHSVIRSVCLFVCVIEEVRMTARHTVNAN